MSLRQDEPIYTYNHQYTRQFIRKACHGRRIGANIQEFKSSLCNEIETIFQKTSKANSQEICTLMQELKNI